MSEISPIASSLSDVEAIFVAAAIAPFECSLRFGLPSLTIKITDFQISAFRALINFACFCNVELLLVSGLTHQII